MFLRFQCPKCQGSQYRISHFDITANNPAGARCIFCKTVMTPYLPAATSAPVSYEFKTADC